MTEEPVHRRLAVVLAADVVGFSRLMERNEVRTLAALKDRRKRVLEPLIGRHQGRVFKLLGDGVLVEFGSAVNAVQCAIDLQEGMTAANGEVPDEQAIVLRIGVNLGDVIVEGGDLYGDGVNIASRLESIGQAGEILVSGSAYDQAKNKVSTDFENLGTQSLKNIAEPVRTYRVRPSGGPPITQPALVPPDKPSIAVLPFTNMTGDPEQEYFADGVVEDLTTALSRFRGLFVIARNSSFVYKNQAVDARQVGRELGVRYVLEGSVRKVGKHVRITGQLIDAATAAHLWADRFDGDLTDVFELQDKVVTSVVGEIAPRLEQVEIERARRKPTEDLTAYDYYLRGLAFANQVSLQSNDQALRLFNKAIERDPDFALAYARAAFCYVDRKAAGWMADGAQEIAEGTRFARRAIEVGRDDAVALSYAGAVLGYVSGELDDCGAYIDRALALNPNLADAWGRSGWVKVSVGEPDEGVECEARAMRLSPFDPNMFWWQTFTALAHLCADRYEAAASWAERALRDQPHLTSALRMAAASYALAGQMSEAQRMMARLRQDQPGLRLSNLAEVMPPFRRPKDRDRLAGALLKAGLPE